MGEANFYYFTCLKITIDAITMTCRKLCLSGLGSALGTKGIPLSSLTQPMMIQNNLTAPVIVPWLTIVRGKRKQRSLTALVKPHPSAWRDVEFPEVVHSRAGEDPLEARRLPEIPKIPEYTDWHRPGKPPKHERGIINIRGPELVHNDLVHKQFGIVAEQGGFLRHEHFELMKTMTDKMLEFDRMFAQYRVDPLYQSWTKKGTGQRMGGGKGSIHHYVTTVKEGRIIFEIGGHCTYQEIERTLGRIAHSLPFAAKPVTYESMTTDAEREKYLESVNINPFTMDYCLKYNMMGCWKYMNYYDHVWKLKHD